MPAGMSAPARWLRLVLILSVVVVGIVALHRYSDRLPGPIGQMYRHTAEKEIDAAALFYTEAGDVRDFIDETNGRYRTASSTKPSDNGHEKR